MNLTGIKGFAGKPRRKGRAPPLAPRVADKPPDGSGHAGQGVPPHDPEPLWEYFTA